MDPADLPHGEEGSEEQVTVSFTILGKTTSTKAMPRAGTIDFEKTSVELVVPRTVELRDELIVHGVPFEVHVILPPSAEDAEAAAAEAEAAEAGGGEADGGAAPLLPGTDGAGGDSTGGESTGGESTGRLALSPRTPALVRIPRLGEI